MTPFALSTTCPGSLYKPLGPFPLLTRSSFTQTINEGHLQLLSCLSTSEALLQRAECILGYDDQAFMMRPFLKKDETTKLRGIRFEYLL